MTKFSILTVKLLGIFAFTVSLQFLQLSRSQAATFNMAPPSQAFERACNRSVTIEINATGERANAAEILVGFDPAQITITDSDPASTGVQIEPGNAFQSYFYNQVNQSAGRIKIAAMSIMNDLTTRRTFATIHFTSAATATAAQFEIIENESGQDQTIIADAMTNLNILSGATDGSYTFIDGPCFADTQPPVVNYVSPQANAVGVPLTSNVQIRIRDNMSGVDLGSLVFIINGVTYTVGSSQVTYTGNPLDYNFTIRPIAPFPDATTITVIARGQDMAGNLFNSQMAFNAPQIVPEPKIIIVTEKETETIVETETEIIEVEKEVIVNICDEIEDNDPDPDVADVICEGTDVIKGDENVGDAIQVLDNFSDSDNFITDAFSGTYLEGFFNAMGASGSIAFFSGLLFLLSLLQLLGLTSLLGLPLSLLGAVFGKKNKDPWGLITEAVDNSPVPFAVCSLFTSGTENRVDQVVSDLEGRYGFGVSKGNYRLEVKKTGFKMFIKEISISEDQRYGADIELIPEESAIDHTPSIWHRFHGKFRKYLATFSKAIFIIGFLFAFVATIFAFSLLNLVALILYILVLLLYMNYIMVKLGKSSAVINAQNNLRVPFAHIKIFDPKTWKLIDTQVANYNGFFEFFDSPGTYAITVFARGYTFPSAQNSHPVIKAAMLEALEVKLDKGKNNLKILVDPISK